MVFIESSVVIDENVEAVRDAFLNFKDYPKFSEFIQSIEITTPGKTAAELAKGDVLKVKLLLPVSQRENIFDPVVIENTEKRFQWKGNLAFDTIFSGTHTFEFLPVDDGAKTKVVQSEEFTGLLAWPVMKLIGEDTKKGFGMFNASLKSHVESSNLPAPAL